MKAMEIKFVRSALCRARRKWILSLYKYPLSVRYDAKLCRVTVDFPISMLILRDFYYNFVFYVAFVWVICVKRVNFPRI